MSDNTNFKLDTDGDMRPAALTPQKWGGLAAFLLVSIWQGILLLRAKPEVTPMPEFGRS